MAQKCALLRVNSNSIHNYILKENMKNSLYFSTLVLDMWNPLFFSFSILLKYMRKYGKKNVVNIFYIKFMNNTK